MRKRFLSLFVCVVILALNTLTVFSAIDSTEEDKAFPYAVAYSTVKDLDMGKNISHISCVENETHRTVVDTNGQAPFPFSGKFVVILGCYTALKLIKGDSIIVKDNAVVEPNNNPLFLKKGMTVAVLDLIASAIYSNDKNAMAALALSCSASIDSFVSSMNKCAVGMNMHNTVVTNIFGNYDSRMLTTTDDLCVLTSVCNKEGTLADLVSSANYYIKTDEILKDKKILVNDFKMLDETSDYFNSNIYGIGVVKDREDYSVSCIIYNTSKQKYILALRTQGCDAYAAAASSVDFVTRNYALTDISKIIFELGEKTTLKINGDVVNFNVLKNTVTNTNVAVNLYYSKSVSTLNDAYSVAPPETLPESVLVGDVIKGFKILYNGNVISTMSMVVESIGEKKEEEKSVNFTIYEKDESKDKKQNSKGFFKDHIWIFIVGAVTVFGVAVIILIEKLK